MLALEFAWAERALHVALTQADHAQRKAKTASRTQRLLVAAAALAGAAATVCAILFWHFDVPLIPWF